MKKIHVTPSIYRSDDSLTRNATPNQNLKSPTLSPEKIGVEEEDFVVLVTVPPYQNMRKGDRVYLNVGISTSESYEVSENDVGNSIIFLLKKEQLAGQDMRPGATIPISYTVPPRSVEGYPAVSNISGDSSLKFYSNMTLGLTPPNLSSSMSYATEPPQSLPPVSSAVVLQYVDELTENDILYLYAIVGDGEYVHQTRINYRSSLVSPKNLYKSILISSKDLFSHAGKKITLWYTINTGTNDEGPLYKSTTTEINIPKILIGLPVEILNSNLSPLLSTAATDPRYTGNFSLFISIPPYIDMSQDDYIILNINTGNPQNALIYEFTVSEIAILGNSKIKIDTYEVIGRKFPRGAGTQRLFFNYNVYKNDGRKITGEEIFITYYGQ